MIKELKQLEFGIYDDARAEASEHGLNYINTSAYLAEMAEAGDIAPDLIRTGDEQPRDKSGNPVSPVRQLLAHSGVRLSGINAHTAGVFMPGSNDHVKGAEVLFPAFAQEVFEESLGIRTEEGYTSRPGQRLDDVYLQATRPGILDERRDLPSRMVSLDQLVSARTGIDGDTYRAATIKEDARDPSEYRYSRVSERGTFPTFTIALGDRAFRLYKYGAAVEASYEAMRRMRINLLALTLQEIAFGENLRRIAEAIETLLNGDGNSNPALDTLGAADVSIPELENWRIDTLYDYLREYSFVIADRALVKEIRALAYPSANMQLTPQQIMMLNTGAYILPDGTPMFVAPPGSALDGSGKLLGVVAGRGLNEIVENGSSISESVRWILNQTSKWIVSVNIGYEKLFRDSAFTLSRGA